MSTATLKLEKSFDRSGAVENKRFRINKYVHKEKASLRIKRFLIKGFFYTLFISVSLAIVSALGFLYFYDQYSAIVEQRIGSGFWHTRAGIYAAPHTLKNEQKISQSDVVEMLRRSGYVENASTDEVWNGTFSVGENQIEIEDNNYYGTKAELVIIKFSGDKIAEINNGTSPLEKFDIQPELLTGRSEAKRGINHALKYDEIPAVLRGAILSAEDQRFFFHPGIDVKGIGRAFYVNLTDYELKQGGSTITQQLVKNTFLTPEKSFGRKFSEAFLALALEKKMSKEDIFALYCNEIYLGQYGAVGVHGVEQAARVYFDKDLKDINVKESAAIAAMIKNPNRFAPHKTEAEAETRRSLIISKMQESGFVSSAEAEFARTTQLALAKPKNSEQTIAPYFVDAATKNLTANFQEDVFNTNFNRRVYTTIDTRLQQTAEQAVKDQIEKLDKIYSKKGKNIQAALVSIDPHTGHILAMVGGRDYRRSQFNRVTDAMRQPGSVFKPFIYATALERGAAPTKTFADKPTEFAFDNGKPYKPANYGGSYSYDTITMKTALAKSSNVIAVQTAMDTGLRQVARQAGEFGFENIQPYPSMALGTMEVSPLQLAAAYAVFANGGRQVEPTFVSKIISGEDKIIYESIPGDKEIISPKTAYMLTDMMQAVVERGTARAAKGALGKNVIFAGKTGSSKDGWFVGYTPNLVTVAWIGFDESDDIEMTGGEAALPLWTEFMKQALTLRPELGGGSFPMPKGLMTVEIDPETGMLADAGCPHRETAVIPASASTNISCLKHRQFPETLVAVNTENIEPIPETIVVAPETIDVQEKPASETEYKSVDGVPSRTRVVEPKDEPPKPKAVTIDSPEIENEVSEVKTYLERYDSQKRNRR